MLDIYNGEAPFCYLEGASDSPTLLGDTISLLLV
jgi:hypothetical protein